MAQEQVLQYCRLCKSSRIKLIFKKEDILVFKCADCGIVFLGNLLDTKAVEGLYSYYGRDKSSDFLSPATKLRYKKLLRIFERYRKNNTIIDIGCGAGYFMLSASENGWNVDGTEISCEAIKLAEEKGQKVIRGDIALLELEKEKYDVATLFEIMEHASDPNGIIHKLSSILRQGGVLYITTPNYNSIGRRLLGNKWGIFHKEHTFYFTVKGLSLLLNKHGFVIKRIMAKNLSLRDALNIFKVRGSVNNNTVFETQEFARGLAERNIFFSILKGFINFILNISRTGETIYILAEKQTA